MVTYISPAETGLYYLQSRYYNPETCRMLNADGMVSTGRGLIGTNMFSYCNNSPIILQDDKGRRPDVNGGIGRETKEERQQSFDAMKSIYSNKTHPKNYTTQIGISITGACALRVESSIAFVTDNKGNKDLQITIGGLAGTPTLGPSIFVGYSDANSIDELLGLGMDWGTSIAGFGGDNFYGYHSYSGKNYSVGEGTIEIHTDITYTFSLKEAYYWVVELFK